MMFSSKQTQKRKKDTYARIMMARGKLAKARGEPYFNIMGGCYYSTGRKLKGCTELLSSHFWSHYSAPHTPGNGMGTPRSQGWGMNRGKRVDTELFLLSCGVTIGQLHHYTAKVMSLLRQFSWTIIAGQHVVAHPTYRVGTAADLVVRDREGKIIYLEIKCGYSGTWEASRSHITVGKHSDLDNSPKYHALLQLAFTMWLGAMGSAYRPDSGYVVRVHDGGISLHEMRDWLLKDDIVSDFERLCASQCPPAKTKKRKAPKATRRPVKRRKRLSDTTA